MSTQRTLLKTLAFLLVASLGLALPSRSEAADLKLEAQLIWGTNEGRSPDPKHKAVQAEIARKLKDLPFKWSHYFEVNRQRFTLSPTETKRVQMSDECEITVRQAENAQVELVLIGKGRRVGKVIQRLPRNELLVLGGNAPNFTAWFVVLRQTD